MKVLVDLASKKLPIYTSSLYISFNLEVSKYKLTESLSDFLTFKGFDCVNKLTANFVSCLMLVV